MELACCALGVIGCGLPLVTSEHDLHPQASDTCTTLVLRSKQKQPPKMICQRCLKHLGRTRNAVPSSQRAWYSTPVTAQTTTATNPRPDGKPAATTQAGTAQPFSTPLTPKPSREGNLPMQRNQSKAAAKLPVSSVPAGTPLKGLTFEKNKQDPVAKEDAEYPAWLWTALARKEEAAASASGGFNEGDLFGK